MTTEERIALDSLRQLGFERVTLWHLRCVEAYLAQHNGATAVATDEDAIDRMFQFHRLTNDLSLKSVDDAHFEALTGDEENPL